MKYRHHQSNLLQRLPHIILAGALLLLVIFIGSRFIRLFSGPAVTSYTATPDNEASSALVHIQGAVKNTENLFINEYPVIPATDGGFEHTILLQPGYSVVTIQAFDKFNAQTTKQLAIYNDEPPDTTSIVPAEKSPPEDTESEDTDTDNQTT